MNALPTISADAGASGTLPPRVYTDAAVFDQERRRILQPGWHFLCHESDVAKAGAFVVEAVLDQSVVVLRDEGGGLRAFHNVCQHRGHELLQGRGCVSAIVCPYHAWSYRLDGRLRAVTGGRQLPNLRNLEVSLAPVRVRSIAGFVFVCLQDGEDDAATKAEVLDLEREILAEVPGARSLVPIAEWRGEVRANWKVMIENSLECYHCSTVHRTFCESVSMADYRVRGGGLARHHAGPMRDIDADGIVREGRYVYWHLWPATEFSVRTQAPVFSVYQNRPLAVDRTEVVLRCYSDAGLAEAERARIVREYVHENRTDEEDVSIMEAVQRGMSSQGFRGGRFAIDPEGGHLSEVAVHDFQLRVARALELSVL